MPTWDQLGIAAGLTIVLYQVLKYGVPAAINYVASRWIALETGQTEMRRLLEELKDAVAREFGELRQAQAVHQADEAQYRAAVERRLRWLEDRGGR